MTRFERRLVIFTLIFGLLTLMVIAGRGFHLPSFQSQAQAAQAQSAQSAQAAHTGNFYGANESWVSTAAGEWPQREGNWCGEANIEVIANYTYQLLGGQSDTPFQSGGQQRIANDLNSAAGVSPWGTPSWNGIGPGFKADIARDGGTDPRAMTWGITYESAVGWFWRAYGDNPPPPPTPTPHLGIASRPPVPYYFHNVIYHDGATKALGGLARTLERYRQPVSVTIAHGLHFDVISGVYATNDPIQSFPANVDAVNAWDPAVGTSSGGYQSAREVTWDNYSFNSNSNMWGSTYNANNGYDPDPAVGIYVPNSSYPHHWIGNRVDFEPDNQWQVGVDYALDENGTVLMHP